MKTLTQNVREKIAFDIFTKPGMSHREISKKYGVSRSTVTYIAKKFGIQRRSTGGHGNTSNHNATKTRADIDTINWTYDDELISVRLERRKQGIMNEVQRMINTAV